MGWEIMAVAEAENDCERQGRSASVVCTQRRLWESDVI